jgi:uncharacterized protein YecE (DUF72 family)
MAKAYVGTSGWSYDHWRHGVVYPEGLPPARWLPFIAERFDTVELNASFYRWPRPASVAKWAAAVPDGFRFTVKLWRGFTHYNRLEDPKGLLPRFMALFDAMPEEKRGALLVQLPPQMDVDAHRLDRFLASLEPYGWRTCVEFRHAGWSEPGIVRILDDHGAALCVHDMRRAAPVELPNAAPFVYVRRHGPGARYSGTYSDGRIAADAAAIRGWLAGGRDAFVYYNNDGRGYAVRDALRLKRALAGGDEAVGQSKPAPRRATRPTGRRPSRRGLDDLVPQPGKWPRRRASAKPDLPMAGPARRGRRSGRPPGRPTSGIPASRSSGSAARAGPPRAGRPGPLRRPGSGSPGGTRPASGRPSAAAATRPGPPR